MKKATIALTLAAFSIFLFLPESAWAIPKMGTDTPTYEFGKFFFCFGIPTVIILLLKLFLYEDILKYRKLFEVLIAHLSLVCVLTTVRFSIPASFIKTVLQGDMSWFDWLRILAILDMRNAVVIASLTFLSFAGMSIFEWLVFIKDSKKPRFMKLSILFVNGFYAWLILCSFAATWNTW